MSEEHPLTMDDSFYRLPTRKASPLRRGKIGIRFLAGITLSLALILLLRFVPLKTTNYVSAYHHSPKTLAEHVNQTPPHPKFNIGDFEPLTKAFVNLFIEEILIPDVEGGHGIFQSPDGSLFLRKALNADPEHRSLLRRLQQGDPLAEEILLKKIQQKAGQEGNHAGYLCLEHILWYGKYGDPFIWKDFEQLYSRLVMNGAIHLRAAFHSDPQRILGILQVHKNGAGPSPADPHAELPHFVLAGSPKTGELHLFCSENGKSYHIGKIGKFPQIPQIYEKDVGLPPEFAAHSYFMERKIHLRGDRPRYWFFDGVNWVRHQLRGPEGYLEGFSLAHPRHKVVALDQRGNYTILEPAGHNHLSCHGSP